MAKRSKRSQLPGPDFIQAAINTIALGTSDEVAVWKNNTGATVRMVSCGYVPDTAVTGNTTNTLLVQYRNKRATGGGTVAITENKKYGTGTNMVAFVESVIALSATRADTLVLDGETVALNKTEAGTGLALPEGLAVLTFEYESQ